MGESNPLAGLAAVIIGTALAWFLTPDDMSSLRSLFKPALCMILSLLVVPLVAAIRNPKSLFRGEYIVVLGPVFWLLLDPLQGRYEMVGLSSVDVRHAFLAIGIFVAAAWIATMGRAWQLPMFVRQAASQQLSAGALFMIGVAAFTLAFLRFAIPSGFNVATMVNGIMGARWDAPWTRGELGGVDAILDHFSYFGYIVPALTVALARREGWGGFRVVVLGVMAVIITAFLAQGGGRRITGMLFGSALVFWFLSAPRVQARQIIIALAVAVGVLILLDQILEYRGVGAGGASELAEGKPSDEEGQVLIRVDDNFLRLAQMNAIFPESQPYTQWNYVVWVLSRPVPRMLWPGKPLNAGFDLAAYTGQVGVSLSSSVIGELVMAGGWLAVALGGWLYGRLGRTLSTLLEGSPTQSALVLYSIGLLALFVGERSMIELVLMSYGALAWVGLLWFSGRQAERRRPVRGARG